MKTNRELDALVAEHVMGLRPCSDPIGRCDAAKMTPCQCWGLPDRNGVVAGEELESYSASIADAWQVVEKMQVYEDGYDVIIEYRCGRYFVAFFPEQSISPPVSRTQHKEIGMAICLAALKAVGVAVE